NLKMFARWPIPAKGCRLEKIGGAPSSLQGLVLEDPEAVYERIKSKHLVFSESREERGEHVALVKGRLTGHQFESVGL
ncbi:unnamed protein product, partial [Durusdinium trenchii]